MPQSSFSGWSMPNRTTCDVGWSASWARSPLWIAGLDIDCRSVISAPALKGITLEQKSGHKKPGLNNGSAGITSVPGLFSELFNVAASRPAQMTTEWAKRLVIGGVFVKPGLALAKNRLPQRFPGHALAVQRFLSIRNEPTVPLRRASA